MSIPPRCRFRPTSRIIYITINITEGQKYTVSDVKLAGEMLVPEEELRKLITD